MSDAILETKGLTKEFRGFVAGFGSGPVSGAGGWGGRGLFCLAKRGKTGG